jgi:hypothetical protein
MKTFQPLVLLSSLFLLVAASTQLSAAEAKTDTSSEEVQIEKSLKKTKLLLVQDGETEEFNWSNDELKNEAELDLALSKLPEEKREKIKKLLMDQKDGLRGMVFHALDGSEGDINLIDKKIIVKTLDGKSEFDVIKHLLQKSSLTKEQLLELQKLLDSKH